MMTDAHENRACRKRGAEVVDHVRTGAKVLADIGKGANLLWK
jgi:hypothetical protein